MIVKSKHYLRNIGLLALLIVLLPVGYASAQVLGNIPPDDMFQLPWQQGEAWIALDGLDNGTKRDDGSAHDYRVGGAVDFTPNKDVHVGVDTSNFWITATAAGTVTGLSSCHIVINHGNGWVTEYRHLANIQVVLGEAVFRNQRLGVIADNINEQVCVGNTFPYPHLHFVLRPEMQNVSFAGWLLEYNALLNRTTFTKNGDTRENWSYQPLLNIPNLQIALRNPIIWNTALTGTLDAYRYEKWPFLLNTTTSFTLTATGTTAGLVPVILLLDANGNEITRGTGTLTSTQPAGNYFFQIQPEVGQGFYQLFLQQNALPDGPSSSIVAPPNISVGESALVSVNLNNIPPGGYSSVEFACTYTPNLVEISNIVVTGLFGTDPAVAINGPLNGSFIVAIAGTNGQRAISGGTAFTFNVTGLQAGDVLFDCITRVPTADGTLTEIDSLSALMTVLGPAPAPVALAAASSPASPLLTGQVLATKPVTISLYGPDSSLITSVLANADGTFRLTPPVGTYTLVATAIGFLSAQGPAVSVADGVTTKATVSLLAGDIDGSGIIDPYDAMTIAMSYNLTVPDAADLNADGIINFLDLEALAANYRAFGALDWQ